MTNERLTSSIINNYNYAGVLREVIDSVPIEMESQSRFAGVVIRESECEF